MTNWEYFKQTIDELKENRCRIAIVQGEPVCCNVCDSCEDCYRVMKNGNELVSCSESKLVEWAMSEHEELKHCPFCGGEGKVFFYKDETYNVFCKNCETITKTYKTREEAIKAWNRRK